MRAKIEAEKSSLEREAAWRVWRSSASMKQKRLAKAREEERKKAEAALLFWRRPPSRCRSTSDRGSDRDCGAAAAAIGVGVGVGLYLREPSSDLGVRPSSSESFSRRHSRHLPFSVCCLWEVPDEALTSASRLYWVWRLVRGGRPCWSPSKTCRQWRSPLHIVAAHSDVGTQKVLAAINDLEPFCWPPAAATSTFRCACPVASAAISTSAWVPLPVPTPAAAWWPTATPVSRCLSVATRRCACLSTLHRCHLQRQNRC